MYPSLYRLPSSLITTGIARQCSLAMPRRRGLTLATAPPRRLRLQLRRRLLFLFSFPVACASFPAKTRHESTSDDHFGQVRRGRRCLRSPLAPRAAASPAWTSQSRWIKIQQFRSRPTMVQTTLYRSTLGFFAHRPLYSL